MSQLSQLVDLIRSKPLPVLCCIIGIPGSGKSTLSAQVQTELSDSNCLRVSSDDFYLPQKIRSKKNINWRGQPGSIDTELFTQFLHDFCHRQTLQIPRYDFTADDRRPELDVAADIDICLLDGWMAGALLSQSCNWQPDCSLITIYIDISVEAAKQGRFAREANQHGGFDPAGLEEFWQQVIVPNLPDYVYDCKKYADCVIYKDSYTSSGTLSLTQ